MNFFQGSQSLMKRNEQDHYKRVILHLDLDCFYAQVEHNRLKIPLTIPLAVQQWNGLIAGTTPKPPITILFIHMYFLLCS